MDKPQDQGASGPDQALAVPVEPASSLAPPGFDPSRDKPYIVGALDERKAVVHYLTVRAGRAALRHERLPWWAFKQRALARWSAAGCVIAAQEIEQALHVEEQSLWLVNIDEGVILAREASRRDSDGSPEGGDACGSVHDSAGRQASPEQGSPPPPEHPRS